MDLGSSPKNTALPSLSDLPIFRKYSLVFEKCFEPKKAPLANGDGCAAFKIISQYDVNFIHRPNGFNPNKPAILYYLLDTQTGLYKIGITNNNVETRFGKEFCSNRAIALMEQTYDTGHEAYLAEQEILEAFKHYRCTNESWPEEKGGRTEFFTRDVLELNNNQGQQ